MRLSALLVVLFVLVTSSPLALSVEEWRLQSAFNSTLPVLGESGTRFATELTSRSGGDVTVQFLEPGAISSAFQAVAAVVAGDVEAAYTTPGFSAGTIPALAFFTAVPFGAEGLRQYQWMQQGPGRVLFDEFYARLGVKALPCATIGPEGGGWFVSPINTLADFNGVTMRFFGLGADVIERFGAQTVLLAGANIVPALENGDINATEFSTPYIDEGFTFDQYAPNYYYPAWHQRHSVLVVVINLTAWQQLSATLQSLVESVCDDNVRHSFAQDQALTGPALTALENRGVVIRKFPADIITAAEQEWRKIAEEIGQQDADFQRTYRAYQQFLTAPKVLPLIQLILDE